MAPGVRRAALGCGTALVAVVAAVASVVALDSPGETSADPLAPRTPAAGAWVASWGAAMTEADTSGPSAAGFADTTLRQVVHLSAGGSTLRLRLANTYGDRTLSVGSVTVAPVPDGPGTPVVDAGSMRRVTFSGSSSTRVWAGAQAVSDPVALTVPDGGDLAVSIHLPGPTGPATWHPTGFATSYVAPGDATQDDGAGFAPLDTSRYFLTGVDVVDGAGAGTGTVVLVGDSITDGSQSSVDADQRYPDLLAERLLGGEGARRCSVVNSGIGGNRLVRSTGTSGEPVPDRFGTDVLDVPGADTVVVLAGINDIGATRGEVTTRELVDVHRALVRRAHAAGLRAVGATMIPYGGARYASPRGEADRRAVNRWIRTSGVYDAVVDFDRALRDERQPSRIWPPYDSGDHLHPNDAGFAAMADAVDLDSVC